VNSALVISAHDNVATALEALEPGISVCVGDVTFTVVDRVPRGHKVALRAIASGQEVVKYGSAIGTASRDIAPGAHVHTHNVASARGRGDLQAGTGPDSGAAVGLPDGRQRIAEPPDVNDRDA
jgi:altronate hydrolase